MYKPSWHFFRPPVYRMMEKEYVDRFFETGELRLSSFAKFSTHKDEARFDIEGKNVITIKAPDKTAFAVLYQGQDTYILCGTSAGKPSVETLKSWNADAAIKITDTTQFGTKVADQLRPRIKSAIEGSCFYSDSLEYAVEDINLELAQKMEHANDLGFTAEVMNMTGFHPYFKKKSKFAEQQEYRWAFFVDGNADETITVEAPLARHFCEPYYPSE